VTGFTGKIDILQNPRWWRPPYWTLHFWP